MFAQDDVTISVNMNYGKWIEWNGNGTFPFARSWHSTTTPKISVCCTTGSNKTTDIRGNEFSGANNMSAYGDDMLNLMFFSNLSTYQVMVEEGYYIKSVDFDFDVTAWTSAKGFYDFPEESGLSVTPENGDAVVSTNPNDVQHISWTNEDDDNSIYTFTYSVNRVGSDNGFARTSKFLVVVAPVPDEVYAMQKLEATYNQYSQYETAFTAGTKPGQFSQTAIDAFVLALENAAAAIGPDGEGLSVEQLNALAQAIIDTYNDVLTNKVPISLASGYYHVKTGLLYYQEEEDPEIGETVVNYYDKYMYSEKDGETIKGKWGSRNDLDVSDAPSLWKVTNKGGILIDMVNMATDARYTAPATMKPIEESEDSLLAVEAVATDEDDVTYVNLRMKGAAPNAYNYLHQGGHSSGKGKGGNVVAWCNTWGENGPAASEWVFIPVDDATAAAIIAAYEPIKNRELLLKRYDSLMVAAKENLEKALDIQHVRFIKSVDQLSSPYTEPNEGSLKALLDGDTSTFWHSNWSNGNVEGGIHYLQVDLINPVDHEIYVTFTRRPVANDHVTNMSIFGTNDPEAEKEDCTELLTFDCPFTNNKETITSELFDTQGFRYIRLYGNTMSPNTRGYWHMSELQMGYDADNPNAQFIHMGEVAQNLQQVVDAQADLETDDITIDEYNALKDAYEAFMAKFVDPTELREVLAAKKDVADLIVIGNDPGFWSVGTDAASYKTLYDNAKKYDEEGNYTATQSADYIEQLNAKADEIFGSANKIRTDKWYRIKFASEEEFDTYEWDKNGAKASTTGEVGAEIVVDEALYDKYVTVSWIEDDENSNPVASGVTAAEVGLNSYLFFDDEEDIDGNNDLDKFRFIAVGDTAYIIQNKGTGLYIKAGTTGATILSAHPSLFNTKAIGYGLNVIAAKSIRGENQNYLHAQRLENKLVTWNATALGSNSALYIKEAGDVASNYVAPNANFPIVFNTVNTYCYPVDITPISDEGQMWTVSSVDPNNFKLTLNKIEKADGGRPFIYIFADDLEQFDENLDAEMVPFKLGTEVKATEAQCHEPLKGIFYGNVKLDRGEIYADKNALKVNTVGKDDIMVQFIYAYANQAYISTETPFDPTGRPSSAVEIAYENVEDGIQTALSNVAKSGAVYTLDGRLVSKKANLNNLSGFGKGIYILNGTKVVVK